MESLAEILGRIGINGPWLLSQIVNFVFLLVILRIALYQPVLNMLAERKKRIQDGLEEAERVRREAQAAEDEYQKKVAEARRQAQEAVAQANRAAEQAREKVLAEAREEAKRIIAEAQRTAEEERRQAILRARDEVADLAILAARRVIGDTLDEPRQRRLVAEFLDNLEEV